MKTIFTTGEAAEICKVSQQTIIRCIDKGILHGFRLPGSRFRRIPRSVLIAFMKENGIPPNSLNNGRQKILIVDDNPEIVKLFVRLLERDERFHVKTARTGYYAGILTREFMPDLIILDCRVPDVNGNVVCQTIRKNPNFEHMKIVIVSGMVNQDEIDDLLRSGADEFVKKPFNSEKFIELVGDLLSERSTGSVKKARPHSETISMPSIRP
jgi:two-component system OmpR family response regulator